MPTITVDGKQIEAKDGEMILQACLDSGIELPHYCYHPGLSIVASCRICLAEVEGAPKLLPTCQTPVREGMVVHTTSPKSVANQKQVMEYLLVNHPLDCPVCDQAGECYLQDYSYEYGRSGSRFEEDKHKKPKKIVGKHVLLYNDRCIMCTRCVRFTREVSGTSELMVNGRGSHEEIDIFPGRPLDNKLSGNVVDLCPVGALLDRDFLFKQRVWMLKSTPSISPADAGGENIYLQHNDGVVYRVKPRFNPDVNDWWISDDTRYSFKAAYREDRVVDAHRPDETNIPEPCGTWQAADTADAKLRSLGGGLFGVLSPMMTCEEAFLLGTYLRSIDSDALLVLGPVPRTEDETFKHFQTHEETFRIDGEKVPNRRGVERVLKMLGGPTATWDELLTKDAADFKAGWVVGGYLDDWLGAELPEVLDKPFIVAQDYLPGILSRRADVFLPAAAWCEKPGVWENKDNRLQPFQPAVNPPSGVVSEAEIYTKLLGREDAFDAAAVRGELAEHDDAFADLAADEPAKDAFVETETYEFVEV
jgi:NADH-quinone oxidoreductase subunit G